MSNFSFPCLLYVDENQSIYIADTGNYSIIKVDYQTKNFSIAASSVSDQLYYLSSLFYFT